MRSIVARMRGVHLLLLAGCVRAAVVPDLQEAELKRAPSAEVRALLASPSAAVRARAEIALGRIGDKDAVEALARLLDTDPDAAWALGRIEGGQAALVQCLARACGSAREAARALAGPAAATKPATAALVQGLGFRATGVAAAEAAFALGVLARNKDAQFPDFTVRALAAALRRDDARAGAAYALTRVPAQKAAGLEEALRAAMASSDAWTRSLAARAWGHQELPAEGLAQAFDDPDWRVRVEAARGLPTAPGAAALFARVLAKQTNEHVRNALYEAAVPLGLLDALPPAPCTAAMARDRIRKQLVDTPRCAPDSDWRQRARVAALAAELGSPAAEKALDDPDGRVRGAAAGAATPALFPKLRLLLASDPDPYVVQEAAGALAKDAASREAAEKAEQRLAAAREKAPGNPEYDALTALAAITGHAPPKRPLAIPPQATAKTLRIRTSRGELLVDLRPDLAPITAGALAALAKKNFFSFLTFHRVVPDFVVQGGDPRGDGDGGPGWTVPDEHTPAHFLRGTLGIATSGPDTGGSQFFLCHSPQPHLDGRYTIAGQLRQGDDVLDALQPGDTIESVTAE